MNEIDIFRIAVDLVNLHGAEMAWDKAVMRAVEAFTDDEALGTWIRVLDAIDALTVPPKLGEVLH